jgi:hypothetical protein
VSLVSKLNVIVGTVPGDLASRAIARVDESLRAEPVDGVEIDLISVGLSSIAPAGAKCRSGKDVSAVAEPVEVVEDAGLVFRSASISIVIFDSQEYLPSVLAGDTPHMFGVQHMTKM